MDEQYIYCLGNITCLALLLKIGQMAKLNGLFNNINLNRQIKASEMLVAPRISEYFLKLKKIENLKFLKVWKILEHLKKLKPFGKF